MKRQAKGRPNFNNPEKPVSRREKRKDERKGKKQKKNGFYMKRTAEKLLASLGIEEKNTSSSYLAKSDRVEGSLKRKLPDVSKEMETSQSARKSKKQKKSKFNKEESDDEENENFEIPNKSKKQKGAKAGKETKAGKDKFEAHLKEMERTRRKQLRDENKREEKVIKQLEKRLHLNKRKSKTLPQSYIDDGFDYILDICDAEKRGDLAKEESAFVGADSGSDVESEVEEEKKVKKAKKTKVDQVKIDSESEDESMGEDEEMSDFGEEELEGSYDGSEGSEEFNETVGEAEDMQDESENEVVESEIENDEEAENKSESEDENDASNEEAGEVENSGGEKKPEVWEDIYGRLRDKKGNVITQSTSAGGKYVPPALRGKSAEDGGFNKEEKIRLVRTLKGLLNRLSDANLPSIADQIETLYGSHSRSLVNSSIFELTFESIVSPVLAPERLIMVHCLLISTLHANVGPEIGAKFLEELAERVQQGLASSHISVDENKTLDNLFWLLTSLYTYKLIGASCMYGLLRHLVERFTVKDIELLLLTLKNAGFMLRKDDPMALKELIGTIQMKVANSESMKEQPRVRFMLEALNAIKNNNISKIRQYDPEQIEHFRKILRNAVRKGCSVTTLNVTYDELVNSSNRGRWWLVGSAWSNEATETSGSKSEDAKPKATEANVFSKKLLDLAAKMRMNTDVRRNIFCVLMSAEDYVEAFEQLLKVNLSSEQRKEIIYVILECCIREKVFNPYYAALALKFSTYDRTYQMTLQFALWDKLKELQSVDSQQMANMARFFCTILSEKGLPIGALKAVNFAEIDKTTVKFLKEMLIPLLVNTTEMTLREIFGRLLTQNKLKLFKEGLRLFLSHFIGKEAAKKPENEKGKLLQRIRIAEEAMLGSSIL